MFYFLVSKIPIINNTNDEHRIFKVFVVGTILYLILHIYLFSHPVSERVEKYGKYLYYIWFGDAGLSGVLEYLKGEKKESYGKITLDNIKYNIRDNNEQKSSDNSPFLKLSEKKEKEENEQNKDNGKTKENQLQNNREISNNNEKDKENNNENNEEDNKEDVEMSDTEIEKYIDKK
jgi:hypothetical protein